MKRLLALAAVLVALSAKGEDIQDRYVDGNLLYDQLLRAKESAAAYILGIHDAIEIIQYHAPGQQRLFCTPIATTGDQLAAVVQRYLEAEPAVRDYPAAILVLRAFVLAFPCDTV